MLLCTCVLIVLSLKMSSSRSCNLEGTSFTCTDISHIEDFPLQLPAFITKITLIGTPSYTNFFLPHVLWQDDLWTNITELSLAKFTSIFFIGRSFFNGLMNLKFISISECNRLHHIEPDVFESTPELEALYLDGNLLLPLSVVETALKGKASKLKYLSLKELQTVSHEPGFIGNSFINALKGKRLMYFDISFANIAAIFLNETAQEALSELRYFNLSYCRLTYRIKSIIFRILPNLEVLDLSGCKNQIPGFGSGKYGIHYKECSMPHKLKYSFLNNIFALNNGFRVNQLVHFTNCSDCNRLEVLDLSNNDAVHFNVTIIGVECFMSLLKLNVSRNRLEYISPSSIGAILGLKVLDISENQLYRMQHTEDFHNLLRKNLLLEALHLRKNRLISIPNNFLFFNTKLVFLDLSDNDIHKLGVDLRFNVNLKLIYLRNNRLKELTPNTYQLLEELYIHQANFNVSDRSSINNTNLNSFDRSAINEMYKYRSISNLSLSLEVKLRTIPEQLTIDLSDNPIVCTCENVEFARWIITTKIQFITDDHLVCLYGNVKRFLDRLLYQSITYDCSLPGLVIKVLLVTLPVIACLIAIILVIFKILSNRRKANIIANLKRELRKRNSKFRHLVFVPYCSQDCDVVETNILPTLRGFLQKALQTEKEVICTGMDNFVPGRFILDEINRCLDECLVVVPIITSAFIKSSWSQKECSVAIEKDRKLLMLMEKYTDMSEAEERIKSLVETYTRATWSSKEGKWTIHPSIELVCERIITVAAETLNKQKQYAGPDDLIPLVDLAQ